MLLLPGTWHCSAQLQGEPQALLLQSSQPELLCPVQPHRHSPLPVPPVPCQLSSARFQFLGSTTPCPVQLCWFHCCAVPCKPYLMWCYLSSCSVGTDPWQLLCSSTRKPFCPKQPCTSVSSVTSAGSQGSPCSVTATNISTAPHSQSQTAAPVSHRRCVFLASPCCDSFAKSISRGDLEQGHSYFLAHYPSWSIHLWLQGHPEHSGLSGILKCKEKGTCFGNAVAALLGTCKAGL